VAAFVGEGGVQKDAGRDVNAGAWLRPLKYGLVEVFALRMLHCTSDFALLAADASLWIDKHCLHASTLLVHLRETTTISSLTPRSSEEDRCWKI
jgi:hypothetical protein